MNDRPGVGYGTALAAAALAALAAAASLVFVYAANPVFWPPLHLLPSLGAGFYTVEHNESGAFSWMGASASLRLEGLDRRVAWACDIRVRTGRPGARPTVTVAAEGQVIASARVGDQPVHVTFTVPIQQERRGVTLTFTPSDTFTPPTDDKRRLGVMVEDLACRPAAGIPLPPRGALGRASLSGGLLGAAFGLFQLTPGTAVGAAVTVAALQAIPLALGAAPYGFLGTAAAWMSLVTAVLLVSGVRLVARLRGTPVRNTGRFVAAFTAAALYLKLLVLLHPETAATTAAATLQAFPGDRALEAARLGAYAGVGLVLYWLGNKLLGDRLAAAGGVVLYHLAPGSFGQGPAGHSTALAAPVIVLAAAGALRLAAEIESRKVLLVLASWTAGALAARAWLAAHGAGDPLTIYPPLALAGAAGASWGWSLGRLGPRLATSVVLSGAVWAAAVAWLSAL